MSTCDVTVGIDAEMEETALNRAEAVPGGDEASETLIRLDALATSPYRHDLHVGNIKAAATLQEREEARLFMNAVVSMSAELWMQWINERKQAVKLHPSVEACIDILDLHKRSCLDGLSIQLHYEYAIYVVSLFYVSRGYSFPNAMQEDGMPVQALNQDPIAAGVFTAEFVREELGQAVSPIVRHHLPESQKVWQVLHDFELDQLRRSDQNSSIHRMQAIYSERLAEPHMALSATHQLYSTFVSNYLSQAYEPNMLSIQKVYNLTKAVLDIREPKEELLRRSLNSLEAFTMYIEWEREVRQPDVRLVQTLFERALQVHCHDTAMWLSYMEYLLEASQASQYSTEMLVHIAEDMRSICDRVVKSIPSSGAAAALCIRILESTRGCNGALTFSEAQYSRAIETDAFDSNPEDLTQVITAHADLLRHTSLEEASQDGFSDELVKTLQRGIGKMKKITQDKGDPFFRLEKYLLRVFERAHAYDQMEALFVSLCKKYPTSSALLLLRTDFEIQRENVDAARALFTQAGKKRLDYPEYLFDAWILFEHRDGTLGTLEKAMKMVKQQGKLVNARRLKEAHKAMTESQKSQKPLSNFTLEESAPSAVFPTARNASPSGPVKRAAPDASSLDESIDGYPASKRAKTEQNPLPDQKRDRENATVFVVNLPETAEEHMLKHLFRDCGDIREIKLIKRGELVLATVEFVTKDAVPAALTKDKKRIEGAEISVYLDEQSTLYVTNFPGTFDAADVQSLFEPFGQIFETRWPSKRFKASRRFAYVKFVDQGTAQKALVLDGTEVPANSGSRIVVKLSDPARKQNRTDADANKKELYVSGLHKYMKEAELRKLFSSFGNIKGARVGTSDDGLCKGFGFVDFSEESSALAALTLNNFEYRKKRLGVVLADSRVTIKPKQLASGREDRAGRSLYVTGLPDSAQEPLVQQVFVKYGQVESVSYAGGTEAIVVFEKAADVGKLLLMTEPIMYDNLRLTLQAESITKEVIDHAATPSVPGGFTPRLGTGAGKAGRARGSKLGLGATRESFSRERDYSVGNSGTGSGGSSFGSIVQDKAEKRNQADFKSIVYGGGNVE